MRKLFVVGIMSVVGLIAWVLFLNYDLKRFEKEHTSATLPQQDSNTVSDKAGIQNESSQKPLDNADISIQSKESPESVSTENDTNTDKGNTDSVVVATDELHMSSDTQLSPQLTKLFTTYYNTNEEMIKYNNEQLLPLQKQNFKFETRKREILDLLISGVLDVETIDVLHEELDAIHAWKDENLPNMFALQDVVKQIEEKQTANMNEHGFSSFEDFWNTHWKTYETWESEQN